MKGSQNSGIKFFDTHVHVDGFAGTEPVRAIVERAAAAGVDRMLAMGGSPEANRRAVDMARSHPGHIQAAIGYNRDRAEHQDPMDELMALMAASEVVAIGETGLDFHRATPPREAQSSLFRTMLTVAQERRLPVIVHSREAETETLAALEEHVRNWTGPKDRIGVQHCFTGSRAYAERLLELGFYISFSGIITFMARGAPFKNAADLREIAVDIPEDRLLIETDAPWLAPEPFRGQPNEPAHVRRVAETLAELRHTSVEALAAATFLNAERLFGIGSIAHRTHGKR